MQITELGHIVLYVRDITQSSGFYRDVLGWRQILPAEGQPELIPMPHAAFNAPSSRTQRLADGVPRRAATTWIPTAKGTRMGLGRHPGPAVTKGSPLS
jgi:catechol 2,3-dioxygenase-like lactoylglutathione lyase family enzyme